MNHLLTEYKTLVFDCDGVILNSNKVKSEAFYNSALEYGSDVAQKLVDYHVEFGGVSRFKKFEYFFKGILKRDFEPSEFDNIVAKYAEEVRHGLLTCEIAESLELLKSATKNATWLVASGGAQDELREIFQLRDLEKYFQGGIYGSPTSKDDIIEQQLENGTIKYPCLFLGDSRFDHEASSKFNLDFIFISQWSEFADLDNYAVTHGLSTVPKLCSLLK